MDGFLRELGNWLITRLGVRLERGGLITWCIVALVVTAVVSSYAVVEGFNLFAFLALVAVVALLCSYGCILWVSRHR